MISLPASPLHRLLVQEYGQTTYQLIQQLNSIEDKAERSQRAQQIIQLMLRLQPALREQQDVQQKLWNHLYTMAGDELDIDAPVPLVNLHRLAVKPQRIPYPQQMPKLRVYGRAVEELIAKAKTIEDPTEREQATITIGRTMKFLYRSYNKENAKDVTILKHLKELSGGVLTLDPELVESQNLFEFATPAGRSAAPAPFIVPQPRGDREARRTGMGGSGKQRDKQRRGGKKGRQEPQQPPQ